MDMAFSVYIINSEDVCPCGTLETPVSGSWLHSSIRQSRRVVRQHLVNDPAAYSKSIIALLCVNTTLIPISMSRTCAQQFRRGCGAGVFRELGVFLKRYILTSIFVSLPQGFL